MTTDKLKRLQAAGWKIGNVKGFLKLSPEDAALVEIGRSPIKEVKKLRI